MNRRAGVTLIEILIAISLLSLLSGGILVAMHLGLTTMQKTDARLIGNRRVVNARKVIEGEVGGILPAGAEPNAVYFAQPSPAFLQGEPESLRFVTSYSLQQAWRGRPSVASLQVIAGEGGRGLRLILNETPWTGPDQLANLIVFRGLQDGSLVTRYAPILPTPESFVVADRLLECRFSYLMPILAPPYRRWEEKRVLPGPLPLAIRIEMVPLEQPGSDLYPMTLTLPVRVNALAGGQYGDNI